MERRKIKAGASPDFHRQRPKCNRGTSPTTDSTRDPENLRLASTNLIKILRSKGRKSQAHNKMRMKPMNKNQKIAP
jgi:hypothetical protein